VANKRQKLSEPQAITKDIEDERVMVLGVVMGDSACKIDWENPSFEVATSQPQDYLTSSTPVDIKIKYHGFRYVLPVQDKSMIDRAVSVVEQ
jgi:hypothetical protein